MVPRLRAYQKIGGRAEAQDSTEKHGRSALVQPAWFTPAVDLMRGALYVSSARGRRDRSRLRSDTKPCCRMLATAIPLAIRGRVCRSDEVRSLWHQHSIASPTKVPCLRCASAPDSSRGSEIRNQQARSARNSPKVFFGHGNGVDRDGMAAGWKDHSSSSCTKWPMFPQYLSHSRG